MWHRLYLNPKIVNWTGNGKRYKMKITFSNQIILNTYKNSFCKRYLYKQFVAYYIMTVILRPVVLQLEKSSCVHSGPVAIHSGMNAIGWIRFITVRNSGYANIPK